MNKELWKINESLKDVVARLIGVKKASDKSTNDLIESEEKTRLVIAKLKKKNRDGEIIEAIKSIPKTEFPKTQKVEVKNPVKEIEVKKPEWYKEFKLSKDIFDPLLGAIGSLVNRIFRVNVENLPKNPKEYISVRLTDGKFFTGIGGGGGSVGVRSVWIKDVADNKVNPATADNQTNGDQKTQIVQEVTADPNNSSTTNLTAGDTFTGTKTSTLGVVGLQWSLKTSENCTVCIEQSPDGDNWDMSYCFDYIASKGGQGETVQATQAYWRITVKNEGSATTSYFRLQAVLCPIATPLPSSLSQDARLKSESTLVGKENTDRHVWVNPTNELAVSPVYRMVGTAFDNSGNAGAVDANFWTPVVTNSGTVVQAGGVVTLSTTATNSTTELTSVRRARFVAGSAMFFQGGFASSEATAGNTRRIGAYDDNDGVFAQLAGTVFSVGTRKAGSDTLVNSGSFNGNMGDSFTPVADTYYKLTIEYSPLAVYFYVNGKLLHKVTGGNYSDTMTLPIRMENNNVGVATATTFKSIGMYIARQGELITNPTFHYVNGAETTVLKHSAGVLQRIIVTSTANSTLTVYDGLSAVAGTELTLIDSGKTSGTLEYNAPFSTGLYIVSQANFIATIVYE